MSEPAAAAREGEEAANIGPRTGGDAEAEGAQSHSNPGILTLLELRVLSGLSWGACLPIERSITLGADTDADLLLLDAGVPYRGRLTVVGQEDVLLEEWTTHGAETKRQPLRIGDVFSFGPVRLLACRSDTPWEEVFHASEERQAPDVRDSAAGHPAGVKVQRPSRRGWILGPVVLATAAIAVLTLLAKGNNDLKSATTRAGTSHDEPPSASGQSRGPEVIADRVRELQSDLRAAGLEWLTAGSDEGRVLVRGSIPTDAVSKLEVLLTKARRQRPDIPIRLQLEDEKEERPELALRAILGGPFPCVVLDDGQVVLPGQRVGRFVLVAIQGTCVVLAEPPRQAHTRLCLDQTGSPS